MSVEYGKQGFNNPPPSYQQQQQPQQPFNNVFMPQPQQPFNNAFVTQPAPTVVITGAPMVALGSNPQMAHCPRCNSQITTRVSYTAGLGTWLACLGLACIGCDLGCCFIPFCVDSCRDAQHFCPNCNSQVGFRKCLNL